MTQSAQTETLWPGEEWQRVTPAEVGLDPARLEQAREFALAGGGAGYVTRHGKLAFSWGDVRQKFDLKSTTKSFGATALALAIADGKMKLDDPVVRHQPTLGVPPEENRATGWIDKITLLHLATHTSGFEKPGGYGRLLFEPGTRYLYSDAAPNWLAECITLAYRQDITDLMFARVFTPIGITPEDLHWRNNAYRDHQIDGIPRREFGAGVHANVDAMARLGYLYLREGLWRDRRLLPRDFIEMARQPIDAVKHVPTFGEGEHGNAAAHYGLLWWNNADGALPNVPRDAYWSWGLYESLIVVIPSLDMVISRAGRSFPGEWSAHYDRLGPFLQPIVAAVQDVKLPAEAPYRPSPVIAGVEWAPADAIRRAGEGSDNWPLTWGDDDAQYTAYGDGWGFEPKTDVKLSLGFARVTGGAENFRGANIRTETGERRGDGASGEKASGILMIDGVLYVWVRNAGNSRLGWSRDRGRTWQWADWRWTESFGAPTFLNFGRNYAGARDDFVYVYSFDSDSAYQPADRMVLARAPQDRLRERDAYEFFAGMADGQPAWSRDIGERAAVFTHLGQCYRGGVTYNAGLKRYFWSQTLPAGDARFAGGFGIYDAPEPWGPWTTVYFTEKWDVGPGETSSLPTKWMSQDGTTVHLVFSGEDAFSVRRGRLLLRGDR